MQNSPLWGKFNPKWYCVDFSFQTFVCSMNSYIRKHFLIGPFNKQVTYSLATFVKLSNGSIVVDGVGISAMDLTILLYSAILILSAQRKL